MPAGTRMRILERHRFETGIQESFFYVSFFLFLFRSAAAAALLKEPSCDQNKSDSFECGWSAARKSILCPGAFWSAASILPGRPAVLLSADSGRPRLGPLRQPNGGGDYLFNTAGFTL